MRRHRTPADRVRIGRTLDAIAESLRDVRTPPSFGDQLYTLREHVAAVRRLLESDPAPEAVVEAERDG